MTIIPAQDILDKLKPIEAEQRRALNNMFAAYINLRPRRRYEICHSNLFKNGPASDAVLYQVFKDWQDAGWWVSYDLDYFYLELK